MNSSKTAFSFLCLTFLALSGCPAFAASFNCQQARTLVEFSVCAYPELSTLDQRLETAYRQRLAHATAPDTAEQARQYKAWLFDRNRCTTLNCLMDVYAARAESLLELKGPDGDKPLAGVYENATDAHVGRLDLLQTEVSTVDFRLDVVTQKGERATIAGKARLQGNQLSYADDGRNCGLTMRFLPGRVLLNQTGTCGFALGDSVNGNYQQAVDKAPIFRPF